MKWRKVLGIKITQMQFMSKKSQKYNFFLSSLPSSSFMGKKGAFFLHRTSGSLRLFSFFPQSGAKFVFAVSLQVFIAFPKLLQKAIIQQITDVKLFAYPLKQQDHSSTHGINTTFHQIIQHHNVLHLEAVSNAEQPVLNDSYEDICPLLFHRHVSSRFRKEIWMFLQ